MYVIKTHVCSICLVMMVLVSYICMSGVLICVVAGVDVLCVYVYVYGWCMCLLCVLCVCMYGVYICV